MKVDNIQTSSNFTGYYRLANTKENQKILYEFIIPNAELADFPIKVLFGRTPVAPGLMKFLKKHAEQNNASLNWLRNNAKIYNLDLPVDNLDKMTIATGRKDVDKIKNFELKLFLKTTFLTLKDMLKTIFNIKSKKHINKEPYYITDLRYWTEVYNSSQNKFNKFLENNNVSNLDNISEFLYSLADEIELLIKKRT